ncbi:MAG: alpha/beta hydrolase [Omnitrophica bacterium]|nr:alpha/beta hydrolase [Candidatus Omnitrophota bacterium]
MRKIYFFLILGVIIIISLTSFTFIFFEKEKHRNLFYSISRNSKYAGYVEVDRYRTEDRVVYKSMEFRPQKLACEMIREKNVFNKKNFLMRKFTRECIDYGALTYGTYIKRDGEAFDFLARAGSRWSAASGITSVKNVSVFDKDSIATYIPFIDRYDFTRGGAQSFNALYLSSGLLPPGRGKIIFRSIRDEYINVQGKKTKTEFLAVKSKTLSGIHLWVSKKTRDIVRLEIDESTTVIKKAAFPKKIATGIRIPREASYDSTEVLFPSEDIALAGTVTIPKKEGRLPAILLVAGEGPYDRENGGLYTGISAHLARRGYITLRFDRRGIGKSQSDNSAISLTDEIVDIENALKFLSSHEKTDKERILIIAHGESCSYLPRLNFPALPVKGLIMLAASKPAAPADFEREYTSDKAKSLGDIDKNYAETLALVKRETLALIKDTKKEYVFTQGQHVFAKRMSQIRDFRALEGFGELEIPLLLVYGKKDRYSSPDYLKEIEIATKKLGPQQFRIVYFRSLGHFLGKLTEDSGAKKRYAANPEVLETLTDWIDARCAAGLTNE